MPLEADGPRGTMLLVGFVLILVAGVIGTIAGVQATSAEDRAQHGSAWSVAVLLLGLLSLGAAVLVWTGRHELAGAMAVAASVVFLVRFPDLAGVLGLVGGVLALVADRVVPAGSRHLYEHRSERRIP